MSAALFPDVVVNGETVPRAAVAAEAQNHTAPTGKPGIAWRKAANAMAVRALLLQEARRRGLTAKPKEVGPGRLESHDEALIRAVLEAAVTVSAPSEAEIRAEWQRDPRRFRALPLWEVSHILCACDPGDADQAASARARATQLAAEVQRTPAAFARLAEQNSDCGSRSSGGALGQLGPGDAVPEFEAVLRSLGEGQISPEPVRTRHGYHVIRLDACAEGAILPYETVREKISEAMEKATWARNARSFVDQLVASAEISGAAPGTV